MDRCRIGTLEVKRDVENQGKPNARRVFCRGIREYKNLAEKLVLDLILIDSFSIDNLIDKTNLNINDLMVILTNLEIRGLVKQTDGGRYIPLVMK